MISNEKRENAKFRVIKRIIESILLVTGDRELIEGPRGQDLFDMMQKDVYDLLTKYEEKYIDA